MTKEQLHALKDYIHTVTAFKIENRLNGTEIPNWEIERYEKRFDEIMLGTEGGGENV